MSIEKTNLHNSLTVPEKVEDLLHNKTLTLIFLAIIESTSLPDQTDEQAIDKCIMKMMVAYRGDDEFFGNTFTRDIQLIKCVASLMFARQKGMFRINRDLTERSKLLRKLIKDFKYTPGFEYHSTWINSERYITYKN